MADLSIRFEMETRNGITLVRCLNKHGKLLNRDPQEIAWIPWKSDLPRATPISQASDLDHSAPALPDQGLAINGVAMLEEELDDMKKTRDILKYQLEEMRISASKERKEILLLREENRRLKEEVQQLKDQLERVDKRVKIVAATAASYGMSPDNSAAMARTWYAQATCEPKAPPPTLRRRVRF